MHVGVSSELITNLSGSTILLYNANYLRACYLPCSMMDAIRPTLDWRTSRLTWDHTLVNDLTSANLKDAPKLSLMPQTVLNTWTEHTLMR